MKKNIILSTILFILNFHLAGQTALSGLSDSERIALSVIIPEQPEELPSSVQSQLENKLIQIITKYGLGNANADQRFIVVGKVDILNKEFTSSAPPMHIYTLSVTFFIGDGIEGTLFNSISFNIKGVGQNETKALTEALKNLKTTDNRFDAFFEKGKDKIIAFYEANCDITIQKALTMGQNREFDEALFLLTEIPTVSTNCFQKSNQTSLEIFKNKLEFECQQNINKSKSLIARDQWDQAAEVLELYTPDMACYQEVSNILVQITNHRCADDLGKAKGAWAGRKVEAAAEYLSNIPADSECFKEALALGKEIASRLDEREKREWELSYEKYNRSQILLESRLEADIQFEGRRLDNEGKRLDGNLKNEEREYNYRVNQGYDLQKRQIEASRQVGIEQAKKQPRRIIYNYSGWWR
jgi:hypothetical protein